MGPTASRTQKLLSWVRRYPFQSPTDSLTSVHGRVRFHFFPMLLRDLLDSTTPLGLYLTEFRHAPHSRRIVATIMRVNSSIPAVPTISLIFEDHKPTGASFPNRGGWDSPSRNTERVNNRTHESPVRDSFHPPSTSRRSALHVLYIHIPLQVQLRCNIRKPMNQ